MSHLLEQLRLQVAMIQGKDPQAHVTQSEFFSITNQQLATPQSHQEAVEWFISIGKRLEAEQETIAPEEFQEALGLLPSIFSQPGRHLTFDEATREAGCGRKVWREWWVGEFLIFIPGTEIFVAPGSALGEVFGPDAKVTYAPYIARIRTRDSCVSPYIPTREDTLANDWRIL